METTATRKKRKIKRIVGLSICAVLVVLFVLIAYFAVSIYNEIRGKNITEETGIVEIVSGDNISVVADKLKTSGIIKYPTAFRLYSKFCGYDTSIQIGSFEFLKGDGYENIFSVLNESHYRESVSVTFPEGYTVEQMIEEMVSKGLCSREEFYNAVNNDYYPYDYLPEAGTENRLEGFLYPDTYSIFLDDSAHNIIEKLIARFDDVITENGIKEKAEQSGLSFYDAITLASIIQKEGSLVSEFPLISSVFHNRMDIGMKLQSCATVNYILPDDEKKFILTYEDMAIDNPYNTYLYSGLTPTPISNPGIDAIIAAVEPADTDYLYFVAKNDGTGSSAFAETYEEHLENSNRYLG